MRLFTAAFIAFVSLVALVCANPVNFTMYTWFENPFSDNMDFPMVAIKAHDGAFYMHLEYSCHTVIQGDDSGGVLSVQRLVPDSDGQVIYIGENSELRYAKAHSTELPKGAVQSLGIFKYEPPQIPGHTGFLQYNGDGDFYICYVGDTSTYRGDSKYLDYTPAFQLFVDDGRNKFWVDKKCRSVIVRAQDITDGTLDHLDYIYEDKIYESLGIEDPGAYEITEDMDQSRVDEGNLADDDGLCSSVL